MGFRTLSAAVASMLLVSQANAALDPIIMKGTKFFFENGTQFFMRGVAYQQGTGAAGSTNASAPYDDPLADVDRCKQDVPLLAGLRTNTIRTYAIDPTKDHSACMKLLDDAGIYVVSDLSEPSLSINRDSPAWNTELFDRYKAVVDEMSKYSNVIGFFAGNEVSNNKTNTGASAYVKAAVRDTKAYLTSKGGRWMGVGYAANDDADIRAEIAHYFNCGNQSDAIDYWGYNIYSWCGKSSFKQSGYEDQVNFFSNYSVPVFFAEYGCNTQGGADGRIWDETVALYSDEMTGVISGGIVYEYFQETHDYGLVTLSGGKASTMKNYGALKTVIAKVSPSSTAMASYNPTNSPAACPPLNANWQANSNLPPTPNKATCECMYNSLSCTVSSNVDEENYGSLFGTVCGLKGNPCTGIQGNTTTGVFGAFSMCTPKQQLGFALDAYYKSQNSAKDACDFKGQASLATPKSAASSCSALLSSASASNSFAATATAAKTGSGSSATGTKNVAAPIPIQNAFTIGNLAVGAYVLVAMATGAGMMML